MIRLCLRDLMHPMWSVCSTHENPSSTIGCVRAHDVIAMFTWTLPPLKLGHSVVPTPARLGRGIIVPWGGGVLTWPFTHFWHTPRFTHEVVTVEGLWLVGAPLPAGSRPPTVAELIDVDEMAGVPVG